MKLQLIVAISVLMIFGGCKSRKSQVKNLVQLESSPPNVLYHFGAYRHLETYHNVQDLTDNWSRFPSSQGVFGGPYRAGIYLSQHPAYNEKYSLDDITPIPGEPSLLPWFMTLRLKSECSANSGDASKWIDLPSNLALFKSCRSQEFLLNQVPNNDCQKEILDLYNARGIGIVRDSWWTDRGFWFIRNTSCLESLDSSPLNVLTGAANTPEFWHMTPYQNNEKRTDDTSRDYRPGELSFAAVVKALVEVAEVDQALMSQFYLNAERTDLLNLKGPLLILGRHAYGCMKDRSDRLALQEALATNFLNNFDREVRNSSGLSNRIGNLAKKLNFSCASSPHENGQVSSATTDTESIEKASANASQLTGILAMNGNFKSAKQSILSIDAQGNVKFRFYNQPTFYSAIKVEVDKNDSNKMKVILTQKNSFEFKKLSEDTILSRWGNSPSTSIHTRVK
ncbi:MAG: hypothetical protein NT027_09035 [Proteobacteria bacterium]|nr:hypothetical protein [Pseudomonadota bacterium]